MQLYLNFERVLTAGEEDALREQVKRRGEREPLQHILGETSFCGLEITVNRSALIPRPETELLAEAGWLFLNRLQKEQQGKVPAALDFGTGSGCIAIALAVNCPAVQVIALDKMPEALQLARSNAERHGVLGRIDFMFGDALQSLPNRMMFDLVIANPPYIPSSEIEHLQPEVRDYDPRAALDGGPDGLDFFRLLSAEAAPFLKPEGRIMVEFGDGQEKALKEVFSKENWIVERVLADYTQEPRILVAGKTF
jgi:release factor glutamine methyltransferase